MNSSVWCTGDIETIAQAIILSNPNPDFRAGVQALAHALGAKNLRLPDGITWNSGTERRNDHDRELREGLRWNGR